MEPFKCMPAKTGASSRVYMGMGMATKQTCITAAAAATKNNRAVLQKKKPPPNKAPVVLAHECPSVMRVHVLEVPAGRDVLACVAQFARRVRRGALVLGAAGRVADVVLRDPALVLRGSTEILSLAGCFFPSASAATGTAVFLAGPRGAVLGGGVEVGGLVAAGPVVVMLATFVAAALDRLPLEPAGKSQQQLCGWPARKLNC